MRHPESRDARQLDPDLQSQSRCVFVCGAHHFFGKVDADDVTGRAGLLCGGKKHRSAAAGNVEHTVT
jgi:hypothetical protein